MIIISSQKEIKTEVRTLDKRAAKLEKRLRHLTGKAIHDFNLIEEGDRIMVCISGGKDSFVMLDMLLQLQKIAPVCFDLLAVNLDQKQPGFPGHVLPEYFRARGIPHHIVEEDTFSIVREKIPDGKTICSLCSRLRRGILYTTARQKGCNKLALGHHRDDLIETFMLNFLYNGILKTMPPKLKNDKGDLVLIRPLALVPEKLIANYAQYIEYPIIPAGLCGNQEHFKRKEVKAMLSHWEAEKHDSMFAALQNIAPSHMLDRNLFSFQHLKRKDPA
ncbi:MAG: tRNA 2-thiocytidine(32) synthetase TtcA [Acidobacteria bacterium]|nr:MAG: tRNA 2-thiocytidine(32) synthetase TtcA [Acidobacteriota bacterium]